MFDIHNNYRVFLAIVPPPEIRALIRDNNRMLKKHSRNYKFVSIEQIHVTLQFMGNGVSGQSLQILSDSILDITNSFKPFPITIDKLQFGFPGQNIPRILYYSISQNIDLKELVKTIHEASKDLLLPDTNKKKDHAKLINHITVARTKRDTNRSFGRLIQEELRNINFQPITFDVKEIHLISSSFKDGVTNYTVLAKFPLENNSD